MMLELQEAGCHNINWVTPEHVVPEFLEALLIAEEFEEARHACEAAGLTRFDERSWPR